MKLLAACIVLYKNDISVLKKTIQSFLSTDMEVKLYLIDNSPSDVLKNISNDSRVEYVHNPSNPGFGAAHNIAIKRFKGLSKYHLILNPDISFEPSIIKELVGYMDENPQVGVVMPKILYPDGRLQPLAKLLPSPFDFFVRRFIPIKAILDVVNRRFELREYDYQKPIEVPFLSGCFLLCRTDLLNQIGGFDENFFMYAEDIDLCRRMIDYGYKTTIYPKVSAIHDHQPKSFKSYKTIKVYTRSALYYFNKWGWFFDRRRKEINEKTLSQIK